MAEIAVSAAKVLVPMVLHSLSQIQNSQKDIQKEVADLGVILHRLDAYLADMDGKEGNEQHKECVKDVLEAAYHIEDVLEEFMFYVPHRFHRHTISYKYDELAYAAKLWNPFSSVHELLSKITGVKGMINNIVALDKLGSGNCRTRMEEGSTSGSKPDHQVAPNFPGDEEIVGFEERGEALILQLTKPVSRNRTISVVGPVGSGKTTIVKNVYESKRIWRQFDCHAWVKVSQSFNIEELICSMLKQFCESRKEPIPSEGTNTQAKLWHYLQQKRYVVVLDDIWRKEDWELINKVFPSGSSDSRIIVTTRNSDVSSFCAESAEFIHNLTGLPWPVAWDLFCEKAFQIANEQCPPEFEDLSQKIVKRCEGLPLAIVAVGSLLSKKQKPPSEWEKVHDSLGSEIGSLSDLSTMSKILLPSYADLPTHLKSCFLYFCIFPEDYSIDRGTLVRLWIAEGFVSKKRGETREEVAGYYLSELIKRNLVHTSRLDLDGQARYCRVLNLVHEFIIRKSEEVNFFSLTEELDASSSNKVRRLCIDCITLSQGRDLNYVRSAFLFKRSNVSASSIEQILRSFKLVRVLDLRYAPLDKFPKAIILLNLLRYLCLRNTKIKEIPNSIKKLSYLETLDLKQTKVTILPEGILQLRNLRHLLVYWYNIKNYVTWHSVVGVKIARGIGALTNLQKLSLIKSDKHHDIVKELKALTQLRKLGLVDLNREGGKHLCESVEKMKHLSTLDVTSANKEESLDLDDMQNPPHHLRRLYLKGHLRQFPGWISKLSNLFRIRLKWSRLQDSPLDALQELPNLLELEMVDAFTGGVLVFEAGWFKKLKILHIEQFEQLDTVVVEQGVMPMLKKLSLWKCVKLEMLPLGINNLTKIEELLLHDMPVEFTNRLQKTHEDREMVGHIHFIQSFDLQADGSWSLKNLS
ncbi:hypothetical protein RHMOL_Rhmol04G0009300 [Rhododendron molle]|uniref:Uncharacterized protein n=1 Tax=Rhododendron molle TaxID=49168 RepID=A0ACC0NVX2_RHOML|nr:hypothetical protein RHMOL_Rhmol04G0009300 [Rhododendron molle]